MYTQKNEPNRLPAAVSGKARITSTPRRPGQSWDGPILHVALVYTNPRRWDSRRRLSWNAGGISKVFLKLPSTPANWRTAIGLLK